LKTRKPNPAFAYLVEHWDEWSELTKLPGAIDGWVETQLAAAGRRFCKSDGVPADLQVKTGRYQDSLYAEVCREGGDCSWRLSKRRFGIVGFYLDFVNLETLMNGDEDYPPQVYIWNDLTGKRRSAFNRVVLKHASRRSKGPYRPIPNGDESPLEYVLPHRPREWAKLIASGQLADEFLRILNTTREWIPVVDKALAAARKRQSRR